MYLTAHIAAMAKAGENHIETAGETGDGMVRSVLFKPLRSVPERRAGQSRSANTAYHKGIRRASMHRAG